MHCPKCAADFLRGVRECYTCHTPLVAGQAPRGSLPKAKGYDKPRDPAPVAVLEGGDPVQIAIAKAILESAGIPFIMKGQGIQDLFGAGRFPGGVNLVTGPTQLLVARDAATEARRLLKALYTPADGEP